MNFKTTDSLENVEFGKYRLLVGVGQGGMAEVFVAVARGPAGFNKLCVIKRILPTLADDDTYREMFLQEARLAARLNHPNVVQTYEVGEHDGRIFIAMEYLEGQPIHRLMRALARSGRTLRAPTCVRAVCDMLAGLHYAHDLCDFDGTPLRVVHRDISPQNVFVTYTGQVKVLDFGIAKAERGTTKTVAGTVKGKYAYMAPEQFVDGAIDRRVDVFTTAAVLWELIAAKRLFGSGSDAQIIARLLHEPIPRLSSAVPDIDPRLDEILARALERDPERRLPTALAFRQALEAWLSTCPEAPEDLGRIVSDTFSDVRAQIAETVTRQLGQRATLSSIIALGDTDSFGSIRTGGSFGPASSGLQSLNVALAHTTASPLPPVPAATAPRVRHWLRVPALVGGGMALVIATLFVAKRSHVTSDNVASVSTAAAGALAPPDPAPHAVASVAAPPAPVAAPVVVPLPPASSIAPAPSPAPTAVSAPPPAVAARWTPPPPPRPAPPPPAATTAVPVVAPPPPAPAATHAAPAPSPTESPTSKPEGRRFRTTF